MANQFEFFQRKERETQKQKTRFVNTATVSESALKASFCVALRVAKAKKSHTIAEDFILPAAIDMCREVCGEQAVAQLKTRPLSNDTIRRRIDEMADDIEAQINDRIAASKLFALQLDESTDVSNKAMLLAYVRFPHEKKSV